MPSHRTFLNNADRKPRWGVLLLLAVSVGINMVDRTNLSVAAPELSADLGLRPDQLGLLLSAFFYTYSACQVLAGWLVDRFNVYWVYAAGFLLWSAATGLTGLAGGLGLLFALRLALGAGESVAYPSYSRIIALEVPEQRRGLANALIDSASKAGPAVGTMVGGLILVQFGWRSLFYILGAGALIWLLPWALAVRREAPAKVLPGRESAAGPGYLAIARRREAWGTFFGLFAINWAWYFLLTWLPSYLVMERKFSTSMMALYGSLPYWGVAVSSLLGGWASDRWIQAGASPTRVRKSFAVSGLLLGTLMLPASMLQDNVASLTLLTVACLAFGLCTSNCWAITQRLAGPAAAGKWTGLQNAFGNLAGVIAPAATGWVVTATGSFHLAFVGISVVLCLGAASYLFLTGKLEEIEWQTTEPVPVDVCPQPQR